MFVRTDQHKLEQLEQRIMLSADPIFVSLFDDNQDTINSAKAPHDQVILLNEPAAETAVIQDDIFNDAGNDDSTDLFAGLLEEIATKEIQTKQIQTHSKPLRQTLLVYRSAHYNLGDDSVWRPMPRLQ